MAPWTILEPFTKVIVTEHELRSLEEPSIVNGTTTDPG